MWPLDRGNDIVRIGAHALELWRGNAKTRRLVERVALPHRCSLYDTSGLREALAAIGPLVQRGRGILVLESVFVPLVLADTGGGLWTPAQVDALLRHRFRLTYGGPDTNVDAWQLRRDFRFGERLALGYGMAPAVAELLKEAAIAGEASWRAWHPALAWGLASLKPSRSWPGRAGWFGWPEQDRMLLARVERGRVGALNPAAPATFSAAAIEVLVDGESLGSGGDSGQSACIAQWDSGDKLPAGSRRVTWEPIGATSRLPAPSAVFSSQTAPIA